MTNDYMTEAIKEAYTGIENGHGGPFGAVIVKDGKIIGRGHNCVIKEKDPTLHGEMMAIKDACHNLNTYDLRGADLYSTAEPCPMCLGAILWAGIDKVYYGCNRQDSEIIGFRDNAFYHNIENRVTERAMEIVDREKCLQLFRDYAAIPSKQNY